MLTIRHTDEHRQFRVLLSFVARLHFSAEELLLYPRRQHQRRRPHAKC